MQNAATNPPTLRFHRKMRPAVPVGAMKNGATIYRLSTCNGETVYLVRRRARKATAKGYTQATEVTSDQLATSTFTDPTAQALAAKCLLNHAAHHRATVDAHQIEIDNHADKLARYQAAGPDGLPADSRPDCGLWDRVTGDPQPGAAPFTLTVPRESLWTEKYRETSRWLPAGWQAGAWTLKTQGYYDEEDRKLLADAVKWETAAARLADPMRCAYAGEHEALKAR